MVARKTYSQDSIQSPFGMVMPGRNWTAATAEGYRFGYQGSIKNDETSSSSNSYSTFFRELDPRIGKWISIDPQARLASWSSPYVSMGNCPVKFNDPLGDIVKYNSFKERVDVATSKFFSKEFRKEFKTLKRSDNIYTYKLTEFEGPNKGDVELIKTEIDDEGNSIQNFEIHYQKMDPNYGDGVGRSPLHGLFEETFHAADYELKQGSAQLTSPDQNNKTYIGHLRGDQSFETRAWNFAANYAPFAPKIVKSNADGIEYIVTNPLIQQIKALNSNHENPNPKIGQWLYLGYDIHIVVPPTKEGEGYEGDLKQQPLY